MSNTKSKHCDFTFALHDIVQCERIISELPDFDTWAYIKHSPDSDDGSDHYHFYIHIKQPLTFNAIADKLDIPVHMVQWCRNKTKFIQYMIHMNEVAKKHYVPSDIITNNRNYIDGFLFPVSDVVDLFSEFRGLSDISNGLSSALEYVKANKNNISDMPFYSRQLFLMRLISLEKEGITESSHNIR